jgi:hypothetical protein
VKVGEEVTVGEGVLVRDGMTPGVWVGVLISVEEAVGLRLMKNARTDVYMGTIPPDTTTSPRRLKIHKPSTNWPRELFFVFIMRG